MRAWWRKAEDGKEMGNLDAIGVDDSETSDTIPSLCC